jgi:diacylglycerol kinase (ATP)
VRARLIVNPQSGSDRAPALLPEINERLRSFVRDLDITLTVDAEDVARAAARAVQERCDALYIAGGDGTVNAALRGLMSVQDGELTIPVGIIPLGTGNDFSRALDLGEDATTALDVLVERRVISLDVGTMNGHPFLNTSAGGFVADVSETVTEGLKSATGKLAYLIGGARTLLGTDPFTARVLVHDASGATPAWDGSMDMQMFAACNGRFIGGGFAIAPGALLDDGLLDVLLVPRMSMIEFIGVLQSIASGNSEDHAGVLHFRAAAFDLEFSRTVSVNTDGEVLEVDHCHYRVRPSAIRFFCGSAPHTAAASLAG